MDHPPVNVAVFPVAGHGTRFLPATKATPKEMLPVVDRPLIQYATDEAIAAGATTLVFITGRNKQSIANHFDRAPELEANLDASGKTDMLERIRGVVPDSVTCVFIRQQSALGLGHAVRCARPVIGDAPFFVVLPDDLILDSPKPCLTQMLEAYAQSGRPQIAVEEVDREMTGSYGIVALGGEDGTRVEHIVEKPAPADAPSNLGVVGRYLLTPDIWIHLDRAGQGAGGEIQLTDALEALLAVSPIHACRFQGVRYDCGSKLGYLKANVAAGRSDPEIGQSFTAWLSNISI